MMMNNSPNTKGKKSVGKKSKNREKGVKNERCSRRRKGSSCPGAHVVGPRKAGTQNNQTVMVHRKKSLQMEGEGKKREDPVKKK